MATRQNSTNGKPKSPRIQVVLPELICEQLNILATNESRTVSNMAKVLIQEGITKYLEKEGRALISENNSNTDKFRDELEKHGVRKFKRASQRIRYYKKSDED